MERLTEEEIHALFVEAGERGDWKAEGFKLSFKESTWEPTGAEHLDVFATHPKHGEAGVANFTKTENSKGEPCWYANNVTVNGWAKRKGLGLAMVEYAVEQTGIKLANTIDLSAEGKELARKVDKKFIAEAKESPRFHWKKEISDEGDGFEINVTEIGTDEPVGNITVTRTTGDFLGDAYEEESPDVFETINEHEMITDIQHLDVKEKFQGQGVGKYLYNLALEEIKKRYPGEPVFINASPMGSQGLDLDSLVKFYQKAGFEILKRFDEHRNATLWVDDSKKIKLVAAEQDEAGIEDTDYPYYHVSDHPETPTIKTELGEKKSLRRVPIEPLGIYLFKKGEDIGSTAGYSKKKYRWDAKLSGEKILNLNSSSDMKKFSDHMSAQAFWANREREGIDYYDRRVDEFVEYIDHHEMKPIEMSVESFIESGSEEVDRAFSGWLHHTKNYWAALVVCIFDSRKLTDVILEKGYNVVHDSTGFAIFMDEPQYIVLDPTIIQWGPREDNQVDNKVYKLHTSLELDLSDMWVATQRAATALETFASADTLLKKFKEVAADEDFFEEEFLNYYDGEEGKERGWFYHYAQEFYNRLKNISYGSKGVKVYRSINVKSVSKIDLKSLGVSWSYSKKAAYSWYGGDGDQFFLEAEMPESEIDLEVSLRQNLVNPDEEEFRVESEGTLYLTAILDTNHKVVKSFNPPKKCSAGKNDGIGGWTESDYVGDAGNPNSPSVSPYPDQTHPMDDPSIWQSLGSVGKDNNFTIAVQNLDSQDEQRVLQAGRNLATAFDREGSWKKCPTHQNGKQSTARTSTSYSGSMKPGARRSTITTALSPSLENFVVTNLPELKSKSHEFFLQNNLPSDLKDQMNRALESGAIRLVEQIATIPKITGPSGEIVYPVRFKWQFGYLEDNIRLELQATEYPGISDTLLLEFIRIGFRSGFYNDKKSEANWYSWESKNPYNGLHPMDDPNANVGSPTERAYPWRSEPPGADRHPEAQQLETAASVSDMERIAQWYMSNVFKTPDMAMPDFKIVNRATADWLGLCTSNWQTWPQSKIEIQKSIINDEKTLDRVIAHELIHAWEYQFEENSIEYFRIAKENDGMMPRQDAERFKRLYRELRGMGHGEVFQKWADKINQIKGADYVTEKSDASYSVEKSDKEFFLLIQKADNGKFGYNSFFKKTPAIKEGIEYRLENEEGRLFKSKDPDLLGPKSMTGRSSCYVPRDEKKQEKLQEIYESGQTVTASFEVEAAALKPDDIEDAWKVVEHACNDFFGDIDNEDEWHGWEAKHKPILVKALKTTPVKTYRIKDIQKKWRVVDHTRRVKGKPLLNPIIVINDVVVDGNHRLISLAVKGAETVDAVVLKFPWANGLKDTSADPLYAVLEDLREARESLGNREAIEAGLKVDHHTVMVEPYNCTPGDMVAKFNQVALMVPNDALYGEHPFKTDSKGREDQPHVTVLYGLKNNSDLPAIAEYCASLPPIKFTIGQISAFRNADKPYDVLKVAIHSPEMKDLHYWIRENFENATTFAFSAHMTVAYIKKGMCTDLEGHCDWTGESYTCDALTFSDKAKGMSDFPLNQPGLQAASVTAKAAADGWDYFTVTHKDFNMLRGYDHFNRESFKPATSTTKPSKTEFLLRCPADHALTSSGQQSKLQYFVAGQWVGKVQALQSLLPAKLDANQLLLMERWVDSYDKEALAQIKPLGKEWMPEAIAWLEKNCDHNGNKFVVYHGDREQRHEIQLANITFKYPTSATTKPSIARNFGAPMGPTGKPVGKGIIHTFAIDMKDIFQIPALWSKWSEKIKQYAKEAEVIVKPGSYPKVSRPKVAAEFSDEGMVDGNWGSQASGILFKHGDRILLLKRAYWTLDPYLWGIPGGAVPVDQNGKPMGVRESALKEVGEEIGGVPEGNWLGEVVFTKGKFKYTTFLLKVPEEFDPILNDEHTDFAWYDLDNLPADIHPGVEWALSRFGNKVKGMAA